MQNFKLERLPRQTASAARFRFVTDSNALCLWKHLTASFNRVFGSLCTGGWPTDTGYAMILTDLPALAALAKFFEPWTVCGVNWRPAMTPSGESFAVDLTVDFEAITHPDAKWRSLVQSACVALQW